MDAETQISKGDENSKPHRIGSFVVLAKLGEGGMGAVYKARDPALDRLVALKLLPLHLASDAEFLARFHREAAAAAKFSHPNLVQVYAAGEDTGTHFIAMEFVEGESLQKRIQRCGKLDCDEALAITLYAAEALRYAWNKAKLIHRDIKPDNILLSDDGDVKIADLGLAKTMESANTNFTTTGTVMGSPHYISPEQGRGDKEIDFHTDIYSLGCTLYHMLTGRTPYQADTPVALVYKHVHESPPDLAVARPDCPVRVVALVKKMMAKDHAKRPATYDELIAELTAVHAELGQAVTAASAARKRKKLLLAGAGVAVLAVAAVLVWQPWKSPVGRAVPDAPPSVAGVAAPVPGRAAVVTPPTQPSSRPPRTAATTPAVPAITTDGSLPQKEMAIDLGGGVTMDFVLVRPGTFTMGSDECSNATPHKVTISKPFYLGKYEVTQEQWEKVMGSNPSGFKGAKNPVENVNWDDCQMFLLELQGKVPGYSFRLPTEAEWEYACRAGSTTRYCYGDDAVRLGAYAWYKDNSDERAHPVGEKRPNMWGLYDMHGSVREWCADWYGHYPKSEVTDPTGPVSGSRRLLRGGSWHISATYCRSAGRIDNYPSSCVSNIGLRDVVVVR